MTEALDHTQDPITAQGATRRGDSSFASNLLLAATSEVFLVRDPIGSGSPSPTGNVPVIYLSGDHAATTLWGCAYSPLSIRDFATWVRLPAPDEEPQVSAEELLRVVKETAELSDRDLGSLLGVSHTTVGAILAGRASARSLHALTRVPALHGAVARLAPLARTPTELRTALNVPGSHGLTALELLARGEHADAYLVALSALRPRRAGLLKPRSAVRFERGTIDPSAADESALG